MAERYAVANGNWSDVATWDGGTTKPTTGDTVHAGGFTVTIDENFTVDAITTAAGVTAPASGSFDLQAGVDIVCAVTAGTTTCLTFSGASASSITGNVTGSTSTDNSNGLTHSATGQLTVTGDVTSGTRTQAKGIYYTGSGDLVIVGDILSQSSTNAYVYGVDSTSSTGDVTITGDVTANPHPSSTGPTFRDGLVYRGAGIVTITGNVTSSSGSSNGVVCTSASSTLNITGNVTTGTSQAGVDFAGNTFTLTGDMIPSNGGSPVLVASSSTMVHDGNIQSNSSGKTPFGNFVYLLHATNTLRHTYRRDSSGSPGTERSLYTGGTDIGNPSASNVRSGTTFGPSNEYTGTLAIPSGQYVSLGVPVDSGVGTLAHLDASGIRSAIGLSSADLGTTLTNVQNNTNLIPGLF